MNILICGATGFIGSNLCKHLRTMYNVTEISSKDLDLTDEKAVINFLSKNKFDVIIQTAACKDVKLAEEHPEYAKKIDVDANKYILNNLNGAKFIFLSSDYVFNGAKGQYSDKDAPSPTTNYGKYKAEIETVLKTGDYNYIIIRTAAVLGKGSTFTDWLVYALKNQKELKMYKDSYFSPTCINFLCKAVENIIKDNLNKKLFNVVQEKRINRYELAILMSKILKTDCKLLPTKTTFSDLSLIQSDYIKNLKLNSFEESLRQELIDV